MNINFPAENGISFTYLIEGFNCNVYIFIPVLNKIAKYYP